MKKTKYIRELRRFWFRKLKDVKKPRIRKRDLVDWAVFTTILKHKKNGVPYGAGGIVNIGDEVVLSNEFKRELEFQGHFKTPQEIVPFKKYINGNRYPVFGAYISDTQTFHK